jgi:hypothetical protein
VEMDQSRVDDAGRVTRRAAEGLEPRRTPKGMCYGSSVESVSVCRSRFRIQRMFLLIFILLKNLERRSCLCISPKYIRR